jgi:hypothetical protein
MDHHRSSEHLASAWWLPTYHAQLSNPLRRHQRHNCFCRPFGARYAWANPFHGLTPRGNTFVAPRELRTWNPAARNTVSGTTRYWGIGDSRLNLETSGVHPILPQLGMRRWHSVSPLQGSGVVGDLEPRDESHGNRYCQPFGPSRSVGHWLTLGLRCSPFTQLGEPLTL